jgi:predicted PurR-regulated permease PerM
MSEIKALDFTPVTPLTSPFGKPPVCPEAHTHPRFLVTPESIGKVRENLTHPDHADAYKIFSASAETPYDYPETFEYSAPMLESIADKALQLVIGLSTGIFNGVLSFVFALYCLARKEILARQGRRLLYAIVPEKIADEVVRILRMSNSTFSNFISGQCLEAVILGLMFTVCMTIFGMPYMPLVSVTIAVTALVPIVGAFVGCIVGAFFILIDSPILAFWFVIMFLILQQIEGNLIYPRVVGTSIGLPGMWVLVAVAVDIELLVRAVVVEVAALAIILRTQEVVVLL